jgi:hypothetical protein
MGWVRINMEAKMTKRVKNRQQAELKNPWDYVFPNEEIKRAMVHGHAAILVAQAASAKAETAAQDIKATLDSIDAKLNGEITSADIEAINLLREDLQHKRKVLQEAKAARRIASAAMDEIEHMAGLSRKAL